MEGRLNMRKLTEAILANLDHYTQMLAEETSPIKELSEVLDMEMDSEHFDEIRKLADEIRHDLGGTAIKVRRMLNLMKYGKTEHDI